MYVYIYRQRDLLKGYTDVRMQTCIHIRFGIGQFCLFKLSIRSNFPPNVVVECCTL